MAILQQTNSKVLHDIISLSHRLDAHDVLYLVLKNKLLQDLHGHGKFIERIQEHYQNSI